MRVRVGTTSWSYEDWQGSFYPPKTPSDEFLKRYSKVFDLVEGDATFYRIPKLEVTERWAAEIGGPAYAIDDQTAITVADGTVEVVSEGRWKQFP